MVYDGKPSTKATPQSGKQQPKRPFKTWRIGMMSNNVEYSPNEMLLFKHYGIDNICQQLMPHNMYRLMAEKAFLENEQSEYAEAIRRGLAALNNSHYRMTPDFDKLIAVGEQ
jgi:hypothetical protein